MSRRNSRSNPIEYDPLQDVEIFKRKYLLINKHITKMNSGLNSKIEELNSQLSCLYVENLRLRTLNVSLGVQLKQEREKSRRIIEQSEVVASHLVKHIHAIRDSFDTSETISTPTNLFSTPPINQPRARRPTTPPPPRISRRPPFTQINEAESSEEEDRVCALAHGRPHAPIPALNSVNSRLPRPAAAQPQLQDTLSPNPWIKKATRRQSGYVDGFLRPSSPSPGSPITAQIKELTRHLENEEEDVEDEAADLEAVQTLLLEASPVPKPKPQLARQPPRPNSAPVRILEQDSGSDDTYSNNGSSKPRTTKSKAKPRDSLERGTGVRRVGLLKDVTNASDRSNSIPPVPSIPIAAPEKPPTAMVLPTSVSKSMPTLPPTPALSVMSLDDMSDDPGSAAAGGRERRARKSVNYAEPSLKIKMRKPDSDPPTTASRRSPSGIKRRKTPTPSSARSLPAGDDGDTDVDVGAEGDVEVESSIFGNPHPNVSAGRRRSAAISSTVKGPPDDFQGRRHSIAV